MTKFKIFLKQIAVVVLGLLSLGVGLVAVAVLGALAGVIVAAVAIGFFVFIIAALVGISIRTTITAVDRIGNGVSLRNAWDISREEVTASIHRLNPRT